MADSQSGQKRRLRFPAFRRQKLNKGLFGPKYQYFKKEMDRRFEQTYEEKLKKHRTEMLEQRVRKVTRLKQQAQDQTEQLGMVSKQPLMFLEYIPP